MGRINLAALRVRQRAVQKYNAGSAWKGSERGTIPNWLDITRDVPPAQILTRQQPVKHEITQIRTRALPNSPKTQQYETIASPTTHKIRAGKKASKIFMPVQIRYEEDELRRQFFSDHPWELARPRVVLETTGNQYENVDWSTGLKQPRVPLSGESVVQRQLWLLQNTPDLTVPESYEIARKEFYMLRRAEETRRRIAVEEAEHMGAQFDKKALVWGMDVEDKMYDDWEKWSKDQATEQLQKNNASASESLLVEENASGDNETESAVERPAPTGGNPRLTTPVPHDPFAAEAQRRAQYSHA